MDITQTAIWPELMRIKEEGPKRVHYNWEFNVVTSIGTFQPEKIIEVNVVRDYHRNTADILEAKVLIGKGFYDHFVYMNRNNFSVTTILTPIGEVADNTHEEDPDDQKTQPHIMYWRGALKYYKSGAVEGDTIVSDKSDMADRLYINEYIIQLYPVTVEQLRFIGASGIFKEHRVGEVLRGLLTVAMDKVDLPSVASNSTYNPHGVDMVPPDNQMEYSRIIIPHGMSAVGLPQFLQERYGVYSHGIGSYYQLNHWYIYPEYNLRRFEDANHRLVILNVPGDRMPSIERTYRVENDTVFVVSTSNNIQWDESELMRNNYGWGTRFIWSSVATDEFRTFVQPNGGTWDVEASRSTNAFEILVDRYENAGSSNPFAGVITGNLMSEEEFVPVSSNRITSNFHNELSQIARRQGGMIQIGWEHSDPDLIIPGMPVRYCFMFRGSLVVLEGTVMRHEFHYGLRGEGVTTNRYSCMSNLVILLETIVHEILPDDLREDIEDDYLEKYGP